jgi:hypothetical protein
MGDFWTVFPKGNVFLVVIHVRTRPQVLRNAKIAYEQGADGVFLISHGMVLSPLLLQFYHAVRAFYPSWWIGLNFLDLDRMNALLKIPSDASGLWVDNAGIDENAENPSQLAQVFWDERKKNASWQGLYFGGVAFKYQKKVEDVARVAQLAMPYVDVITTSGDATGVPPSVEKMWAIRNAIGDHPFAIASGITPENVKDYLGIADCFLVATGISFSFTELDPARVRNLAQTIHSS